MPFFFVYLRLGFFFGPHSVDTVSETEPSVHLGFASIPVSLSDQIERTLQNTTKDWFDTESAWTAEIGADISIALNSFKIRSETDDGEKKKQKFREIVLVVRADKRIDERQADSLFETVSRAIEGSEELDVWPWERVKELGKRQMVWTHTRSDGGRKIVRPIVERAVEQWKL